MLIVDTLDMTSSLHPRPGLPRLSSSTSSSSSVSQARSLPYYEVPAPTLARSRAPHLATFAPAPAPGYQVSTSPAPHNNHRLIV